MNASEAAAALRSALDETGPAEPVRISQSIARDLLRAFTDMIRPRPRPLTVRQRQILSFIETWIADRGVSPTYSDIASAFEMKSLASVSELLDKLERKGHIRRQHNQRQSIEVLATG